jgi:hypothetical protein
MNLSNYEMIYSSNANKTTSFSPNEQKKPLCLLRPPLHSPLLIIDEIRGRRIALQLGLKVHGILGILTRAKREGRIVSLRQALDLLRERGTWIDQELYNEVLRIVGE